jgi:hypothetical protein
VRLGSIIHVAGLFRQVADVRGNGWPAPPFQRGVDEGREEAMADGLNSLCIPLCNETHSATAAPMPGPSPAAGEAGVSFRAG